MDPPPRPEFRQAIWCSRSMTRRSRTRATWRRRSPRSSPDRQQNSASFTTAHRTRFPLRSGKCQGREFAQGGPGSGLSEGAAPLGLTLAPAASAGGTGQGVVVTNVNPDGPAAERGMRAGDVILDVAGKAVNEPVDVRAAVDLARTAGKHSVLMRIKSGKSTHFVAMPVATG